MYFGIFLIAHWNTQRVERELKATCLNVELIKLKPGEAIS